MAFKERITKLLAVFALILLIVPKVTLAKNDDPNSLYLKSLKNIAIVVAVPESRERMKGHCDQISQATHWDMGGKVHCFSEADAFSTFNIQKYISQIQQKTGQSDIAGGTRYFITLTPGGGGNYRVEVRDTYVQRLQAGVTSKAHSSFMVSNKSALIPGSGREGPGRFINNFELSKFLQKTLVFFNNQQKLKNVLLANGVYMSKNLTYDSANSRFYRCSKKTTSSDGKVDCAEPEILTAQEATVSFINEKNKKGEPEHNHYLRAGLEIATILGISTAWYQAAEFKEDWDFAGKSFSEVLKAKFVTFKAWKFDDNGYKTNFQHIVPAGWAYYGILRSNDISPAWSLIFSMLTSTVWESTVEYREVTSINDQIFTPIGGAIAAEAGYQIGKVLRAKPEISAKVVGYLVDPFTAFNHMLDLTNRFFFGGPKAKTKENLEEIQNFYSQVTAHFSYGIQQRTTDTNNPNGGSSQVNQSAKISLVGKVVNIHDYLEEGEEFDFLSGIIATDARLTGTAYGSPNDWSFQARHMLAALYLKRINEDNQGELNGFSLLMGPAVGLSASTYGVNKQNLNGDNNDFSTALHVLGPSVRLVILKKDIKVSIDMNISGDLGMIKSYAIEKYKQANGANGLSSLTGGKDYMYTYGYTTSTEVKIQYYSWTAGFSTSFTSANDLNPDMTYPEVPYSSVKNGAEAMFGMETYLEYKIRERWGIRLTGQYRKREGVLGDFNRKTGEYLAFLSVIYYF